MKPRRTLLVVINKKVEWGILSVADIAVKWVNFRLHRSGGPRGTELAACDALAKALDYLPLALDQAAVYMAAPGLMFSKASPSARASSAIKVDLLNTTRPTPVHARTPAARNTGARP